MTGDVRVARQCSPTAEATGTARARTRHTRTAAMSRPFRARFWYDYNPRALPRAGMSCPLRGDISPNGGKSDLAGSAVFEADTDGHQH